MINTKTLERLRTRGQRCDVYACKNMKLNAINGTQIFLVVCF